MQRREVRHGHRGSPDAAEEKGGAPQAIEDVARHGRHS